MMILSKLENRHWFLVFPHTWLLDLIFRLPNNKIIVLRQELLIPHIFYLLIYFICDFFVTFSNPYWIAVSMACHRSLPRKNIDASLNTLRQVIDLVVLLRKLNCDDGGSGDG